MTANEIIRLLDLKPHPEGGYFRESYKSPGLIPGSQPPRAHSTAIYYLLVPGAVSKIHRLTSDEVFHFYLGDPVTWILLSPGMGIRKIVLGNELERGQIPQMVVPAGTWFGGWLEENAKFSLMGTTVAPGFDFADFTLGNREELLAAFPQAREEVVKLT